MGSLRSDPRKSLEDGRMTAPDAIHSLLAEPPGAVATAAP